MDEYQFITVEYYFPIKTYKTTTWMKQKTCSEK